MRIYQWRKLRQIQRVVVLKRTTVVHDKDLDACAVQ